MISTLLPNSADAAKGLGALVLLGAVYVGGVMTAAGGGKAPVATLSHQSDLITAYDDLESTAVTAIRYGDAPDSTRTDCIEVPAWLDTLQQGSRATSAEDSSSKKMSQTTSDSRPLTSEKFSIAMRGLPYVITPMMSGRPSLFVENDQAVLQSLSPRDGTPIEFEYDLPRDTWRVNLSAQGTALQGAAVASTNLQVRRRTTLGWVGGGPAYGAVVTDEVATGAGVTVSFNTTLWSR